MKNKLLTTLLLTASILLGTSLGAFAQQTIKGKVTDMESNPLPGVAVYLKGTTIGVVTDDGGNYSVTNKMGSKALVFSALGMKEREEIIGNRTLINVVMEEDKKVLDEIVVIGYQEVSRRDLMGAVTSVDSKTVNSIPAPSFTEALSGKMAGVNVVTTEGDPDAAVQIKVRGTGSITQDASPLYIVDGFPVKDINDIAAQDIKSVDVLKDAFSTAIYGSRGAYGVVLITTKDSARGRVSVSYEGYGGIKVMANRDNYQMMSPYQYASSLYEYYALSGTVTGYNTRFGTFQDMDLYKHLTANDWKERLFGRVGTTMNHSININGSSGKTRWSASYTRMDEDAIMINSSYVRNNFSFRGYSNPVKNLSFNISVRYSSVDIAGAGANSINDKGNTAGTGRMIHALRYAPIPMDYLSFEEDFDIYSQEFGANPIREVNDNDRLINRENWNANGSVTWTIIPNLRLKVEGGISSYENALSNYYGVSSYFTRVKAAIQGAPNTENTTEYQRNFRNVNTLSYNFGKIFKDKRHKLDILVGQEYQYTKAHTESVVAEGFPTYYDADMARRYMGTAELISSANDYYNESDVMLSFFGRGNYVYDNRYSISAAFRTDGSSKFSKENRWGIFPSAAVSWTISNERWMRRAKQVNQLKLRYSVGVAGNNRIPSGQVRRVFKSTQDLRTYEMTNWLIQGTALPNPDLKWEKTLSHNIGLDFAFFNQRLSGTIEAYHNTSQDLLINYPLSGVGYSSQYRNLGSVLNRGLELSLRGVVVEKKNFGLTLSGNIAYNQNRVTSLGGLEHIQTESRIQATGIGWDFLVKEGRPLGEFYGYQSDGWYTVDDFDYQLGSDGLPKWTLKEGVVDASNILTSKGLRPGAPKFKNQNDDNVIDSKDKVALGSAMPIITGGFNIATNFYGFDLTAAFSYSCGGKLYNGDRLELTQKGGMYKYKNLLASSTPGQAWTNVDWNTGELIIDPAYLAEVNKNATTWNANDANYFLSDEYVEDASFLRLNSLTLGYTIPIKITQWAHISNLRIYVTASNLFCLTKYSGYDPEVNCRRHNPLTPGIDYSAYPKSKAIVGGLSVTF